MAKIEYFVDYNYYPIMDVTETTGIPPHNLHEYVKNLIRLKRLTGEFSSDDYIKGKPNKVSGKMARHIQKQASSGVVLRKYIAEKFPESEDALITRLVGIVKSSDEFSEYLFSIGSLVFVKKDELGGFYAQVTGLVNRLDKTERSGQEAEKLSAQKSLEEADKIYKGLMAKIGQGSAERKGGFARRFEKFLEQEIKKLG